MSERGSAEDEGEYSHAPGRFGQSARFYSEAAGPVVRFGRGAAKKGIPLLEGAAERFPSAMPPVSSGVDSLYGDTARGIAVDITDALRCLDAVASNWFADFDYATGVGELKVEFRRDTEFESEVGCIIRTALF